MAWRGSLPARTLLPKSASMTTSAPCLPPPQARSYSPSRFSFNTKDGRCEECAGEGLLRTHLQLMADVETICPVCKGAQVKESYTG